MLSYKEYLQEAKDKVSGYVYITQRDNDKFLNQKAATWRDGFSKKKASIKLIDDPSETYEHGQYGVVKLFGVNIIVSNVGGRDEWEIEGIYKG